MPNSWRLPFKRMVEVSIKWHKRITNDNAHQWYRTQVRELVSARGEQYHRI